MPAMPRIKGKAEKIAHKLLGIPANMRKYKVKSNPRVKERLNFEETRFIR